MRKDLKKACEHVKNAVNSLQKVQDDDYTPGIVRARVSNIIGDLESLSNKIEDVRRMHVH